MSEIQNAFIEYASQRGDAIEEGDHKKANRLHSMLMSIYEKIQKNEKWEELKAIIKHPDENVRLWAATFLLRNDNIVAMEVLSELSKSPKIVGLTASTTIDMWNKGMLGTKDISSCFDHFQRSCGKTWSSSEKR